MASRASTHPVVLSTTSLSNDSVVNRDGKDLGKIKDIMIDVEHGRVAYAVLSFGGFMGMGDKLFAIPWSSLELDTNRERFLLDVSKEQLERARGFDKDDWPNFADPTFRSETYETFNQKPYWS
ncbi:MAG: PRC-barrel domain-containing protein [Planctomycetota bacterium]